MDSLRYNEYCWQMYDFLHTTKLCCWYWHTSVATSSNLWNLWNFNVLGVYWSFLWHSDVFLSVNHRSLCAWMNITYSYRSYRSKRHKTKKKSLLINFAEIEIHIQNGYQHINIHILCQSITPRRFYSKIMYEIELRNAYWKSSHNTHA